MEENKINFEGGKNIIGFNPLKKFISESNMIKIKELCSKNEKYIYFFCAYAEKHMSIYLKNYNKRAYLFGRRNLLFIKKNFVKKRFSEYKYKNFLNNKIMNDLIFLFIIIFVFIIYKEVLKCKMDINKDKYKQLELFSNVLSNFLQIVGNFYSGQLINEEELEEILKFIIILSIASKNTNTPNMNDKIINMMFLVQDVKIIKIIFNKIYNSTNQFSEKQKQIVNNIIIFIKDNIIGYSDQKPLNIINKFYLSHNDYYTTSLIDLVYIIIEMKEEKIIKNFIELLTNIYIFSFDYKNVMCKLLKILEPLLLNIDKKYLKEIDLEIDLINFIIRFLQELDEREEKLFKKEPLLKEGFFLGHKFCGLTSEIDTLEEEFSLIFGFCLHEITNKTNEFKEWTLINIRTKENKKNKDKHKISQIKIWLSKRNDSNNEYDLMISDNSNKDNKDKKTGIIIKTKLNYNFSFNFTKNKKVKISYINDTTDKINKTDDINLKFNIDNTDIYVGCDITKKENFEEKNNTFFGEIGTVIIINNKKLSKKDNKNIDLILKMSGDYDSILKDNKVTKNDFVNNDIKYHFKNRTNYNDNINKLNEIYKAENLEFIEVIKTIISPFSFELIEYQDEIDYLKKFNYYKYNEDKKKIIINKFRQNYLNLKQKNTSKGEKTITIWSPFFNSKFNVFKNNFSIEEFIKYDGIYYLCLLLEYFYQILCKIQKEKSNNNYILIKIEKNILDIIKFFYDNLIYKDFFKDFIKDINKFFYQMTVTLKLYIKINKVNEELIKIIYQLIEKIIDLSKENEDIIYPLKNKFFGLLHDILLPSYNADYYKGYFNFILNLLNQSKLDDLYSEKFINEFLSMSGIFDNNFQLFKNIGEKSLNELRNNYEDLLINILKHSNDIYKEKIEKKKNLQITDKKNKIKNMEGKQKKEKEEHNPYLASYIERTLQEENPLIVSKFLNVIYKSGLILSIESTHIEQIKNILINNYKYEKQKLKNEACLKILLNHAILNKNVEETIHEYLKKMTYYKGFFFSIIAAIRQIKFMQDDNQSNKDNIIKTSFDSTDQNNENKNNIYEKYPLLDDDLKYLSKKQKRTLIKLLQDCISMLFLKESELGVLKVDKNIKEEDAIEIYNTLKINFNYVLEEPKIKVYDDIFSSEKQITPELFYFKWKKSKESHKLELLEDIKKFHYKLLKNHRFPFIFNFILLINSDKETEGINFNSKIDFILSLLTFLIEEFEEYFKVREKKINKEEKSDYAFINNLINFLVLLNKLISIPEYETIYLNNDKFVDEIFFKLIELLKGTGLLYTNYCFEVDDYIGKIISEICYDIFITLLINNFAKYKKKFLDTFVIYDKQIKKYFSIFYIIDLNKEEILRKEKIIRKEILIKYLEDSYNNLKIINEYIFNWNEPNSINLVFGKKIYKIEGVNFSLFFLAKTFIYLKEMENIFSKELKDFLKDNLTILSVNLFDLWTKNNEFYGHKICSKFLLYKETKDFFESHIIQCENKFKIYEDFFKDIHFKLNGQDKIAFCYSLKLLDLNEFDLINNNKKEEGKKKEEKNTVSSTPINISRKTKNFLTFDEIKKENIILNPKNYFLKTLFSNIYKNIFFKDKVFQKIKYTFAMKYHKEIGFDLRTKQLEYPSTQKNFSNSLEPKTFIRRDYKFYKNDFFPISHEYINDKLISDRDENKLFFYEHEYEGINDNKINEFKCELITNKYLIFGKFLINHDYIYFKSEEHPRDINPKEAETIYSEYIFSMKDKDNCTKKKKEILMFIDDIKEIMKKRVFLIKQALEIYNKNGKSYFFNFFKKELCEKVEIILTKECKCNIIERNKDFIKKFKRGEISNYDYILYLNKFATRTYNELSQYPIFPWIVKDISKLINEDNNKNKIINNNKNEIKLNKDEKSEGKKGLKKSFMDKDKEEDSNNRDMNYPISMQSQEKREKEIDKYEDEMKYSAFPSHLGTHYSTSSYVYFYLMRNNPYCQNLIKLQNYKQEHPNRMFLSFQGTQKVLESSMDNRELIPEMFCYIDFLVNLNCAFFGMNQGKILVDDFIIYEGYKEDTNKNFNFISDYMKFLYLHKKLLNSPKTSYGISQWVDIIFGKKQLPDKREERIKSCNIFGETSYEQRTHLDEKLEEYIKKLEENKTQNKKKLEFDLLDEISNKIDIIKNFGVCPCQILNETIYYEGNSIITNKKRPKNYEKPGSNYYHLFAKINNIYFYLFEIPKDPSTKTIQISDDLDLKKNSYQIICGNFETNLFIINASNDNNDHLKYLYKPNYLITLITIYNNKFHSNEIFALTCRYLGNYFKVQNSSNEKKIICEAFVTTIASENHEKNEEGVFFTGLKNGKLIKWKINIDINENQNNKNKTKGKSSLFIIEEINHVYDHKKSITAIEINSKKEIIATAGEDKFIHIRKLYDLEILTSINLIYCYGNDIISKNKNIFPSLIRISDLNCIYVLLYNFDSDETIIRGYTLNGLFFAQTENNENEKMYYNNIIINKNGNLLVGLYNDNKILKLNSFNLKIRAEKDVLITSYIGNKWIEFDSSNNCFIILYDNLYHFVFIDDENNWDYN